jgi:hypothetical protein
MFFCMNRFIPVSAPLEPIRSPENGARSKWGEHRTAAIPVQGKSARKKAPDTGLFFAA